MTSKITIFIFLFCVSIPYSAQAARVKAVASLPEIAWLMEHLAPNLMDVETLISGQLDPHHVESSPSFVFKLSNADLFCFSGLELEVGWLEKSTVKSANPKIQKGGAGYCDLSQKVKVLGATTGRSDRSRGDLHPKGNPHYLLSLTGMQSAADVMVLKLKSLLPEEADAIEARARGLKKRLKEALENKQKQLKEIKAGPVLEFHKEFAYYLDELQLKSLGSIEPLPGVPPSAAHLALVAKRAQEEGVKLILFCEHHSQRYSDRMKELTKIPVLRWPCVLPLQQDFLKHWESLTVQLLGHFLKEEG